MIFLIFDYLESAVRHYLIPIAMLFCATSSAMGQSTYPTRPIAMVVPFPAGGALDIVTRNLAKEMTPLLGQALVVENRAGAAGTIGSAAVAKSQAGLCTRSLQFDCDDEVANKTVQKIHDLARRQDKPPFFLTAFFTHPHNPYVTTKHWWDQYQHSDIDMPEVSAIPYAERDAHSQRLHWLFRQDEHTITDEHVRTARHAYYANISYVDEQIGRILNADVLSSQKRRRWIQDQLNSVDSKPWDYQPFTDAAKQFVRGGKNSSPTAVKGRARYPFVTPKAPDTPRQST